jgi:hypothetical protein
VAQFRVEFVLDQSTGKYLAELYHPNEDNELLVRTEALYPTQAAAVLGVVQLFKNAILQLPEPGATPRKARKARKVQKTAQKTKAKKTKVKKSKAKKSVKAKKRASARRAGKRPSAGRRSRRTGSRRP